MYMDVSITPYGDANILWTSVVVAYITRLQTTTGYLSFAFYGTVDGTVFHQPCATS